MLTRCMSELPQWLHRKRERAARSRLTNTLETATGSSSVSAEPSFLGLMLQCAGKLGTCTVDRIRIASDFVLLRIKARDTG